MRCWTFTSLIKYFVICIIGGIIALQIGFIIQISLLNIFNPISTSFMTNEYNRLCFLEKECKFKQEWLDYTMMGAAIKKAVIASEDSNFTEHNGIEIDSLLKAWEKNHKKGKIVAGGSTITQQLAKNLFLSSEKNYLRKIQELLLSFYLEALLDKRRIFEIYLNIVEWGEGIFGIKAASNYYFNKNPEQLTNFQAAKLAAALPAPKCFDDDIYCHSLNINFYKKTRIIAKRMGIADIPTAEENIFYHKHTKKSK